MNLILYCNRSNCYSLYVAGSKTQSSIRVWEGEQPSQNSRGSAWSQEGRVQAAQRGNRQVNDTLPARYLDCDFGGLTDAIRKVLLCLWQQGEAEKAERTRCEHQLAGCFRICAWFIWKIRGRAESDWSWGETQQTQVRTERPHNFNVWKHETVLVRFVVMLLAVACDSEA